MANSNLNNKDRNKNSIFVDFHVHTCFSFDCKASIADIVKAAQGAGLNAIAITDHDTLEGVERAQKIASKENVTIIPGVEITAAGGTHIVGLFINKLPRSKKVLEIVKEIKSLGGLAVLPHPHRSDTGLFYNWKKKHQFTTQEINKIMQSIDLIEVVNHKSILKEEKIPLDLIESWGKPFLAGSDAHYPFEIGNVRTKVLSLELEEIAKGSKEIFFYRKPIIQKDKIQAVHFFLPSLLTNKFLPSRNYREMIKKKFPLFIISILRSVKNYFAILSKKKRNKHMTTKDNLFKILKRANKITIEPVFNNKKDTI